MFRTVVVASFDPRNQGNTTDRDIRDVRVACQSAAAARRQEAREEFQTWYRNCNKR